MTQAQLILALLAAAAISVAVIVVVVRSILREMQSGLGDDDKSQAAQRGKNRKGRK